MFDAYLLLDKQDYPERILFNALLFACLACNKFEWNETGKITSWNEIVSAEICLLLYQY